MARATPIRWTEGDKQEALLTPLRLAYLEESGARLGIENNYCLLGSRQQIVPINTVLTLWQHQLTGWAGLKQQSVLGCTLLTYEGNTPGPGKNSLVNPRHLVDSSLV